MLLILLAIIVAELLWILVMTYVSLQLRAPGVIPCARGVAALC